MMLMVAMSMMCCAVEAPGTPCDCVANVRGYGAAGDGVTADTAAVQSAIDAQAGRGGGTVLFPAGVYACGTLRLRSDITLRLEAGATLLGIRDDGAYLPHEELGFKNDADRETSFFHRTLILGEDVERIAIVGEGTIDSNWEKRNGPKTIALKRCNHVRITGVRILNAPNYAISMLGTDYVDIDGVTILNAFADGIDPDSCRNVRIANCHIESVDDAIVPKTSFSLGERRSCENITVTNCYLSTICNGFKLGTESGGDFKRIAVSNCVITGMAGRRPAKSGISLLSVDGANIDGVVISNITMFDVRAPMFLRLGNRGRDMETPAPGSLRNVSISNIVATRASLPCSIAGIPGHAVEGVSVSDIQIAYVGGTLYREPGEAIPEVIDSYPDPGIFEALPLYGFFCRHVKGLTLRGIDLHLADPFWRLDTENSREINWQAEGCMPVPSTAGRPGYALLCDDVESLRIDGFMASPDPGGQALMHFAGVRDALVRGCAPYDGTGVFLECVGAETRGVALIGNDLTRAGTALVSGGDLPAGSVQTAGNLGL